MTRSPFRAAAALPLFCALAAIPLPPSLAAQQSPALRVQPCTVPAFPGQARCGTFEVWENRAAASGRRITLHFTVFPAADGAAAREAIVPLAGGPGQAASDLGLGIARQLRPSSRGRDVLVVDLRGTGGSNLLKCNLFQSTDVQTYLTAFYPAEGVRRCAGEWAQKADVTQYTSVAAADDLEELRAALGYEWLDLYGLSYGTRQAQRFVGRHPEHVREIILHGALPNDSRYPLHVAPDAQLAMDGVLGECEREPGCHAAFPRVRDELREVVQRLERAPVQAEVMQPPTGQLVRVTLTRDLFGEALRYMLYSSNTASLVPVMIHRAAQGDFGPVAEQAVSNRRGVVDEGSHGIFLSITCNEDLPFFETAEGERLARNTFLGGYRVRDQKAACAAWPHDDAPRSMLEPVRWSGPVLLVTGEWDPVTPPWQARAVAQGLPNGRLFVIPSGGHGFDGLVGVGPCVDSLVNRFVVTADAKALDGGCLASVHRPPFPTTLRPTRPVTLTPAQMQPFVGRYRGAFPMEVKMANGRLVSVLDGNREFAMVAVGASQFRLVEAPGVYLTFRSEGGTVRGVEVDEGGGTPDVLERVP